MNKKIILSFFMAFLVMGMASATLTFTVPSGADEALENTAYGPYNLTTAISGDTGTLRFSFTTEPAWLTTDETGLISGNPDNEDYRGDNTVEFTVTDDKGTAGDTSDDVTGDFTFDIYVFPNFCDVGDEEDIGVSIDFDDDDYKPGDIVQDLEADVDAGNEDLSDVEVEFILYDLDTAEEVDSETSANEDIDEGDDFTFDDVDFKITNDEDLDDKDNYRMYAVAIGEDDNGDDHCDFDFDSIDIKRDKHDVIIDSFTLSPRTVECGETFTATIKVENIGRSNEDDVYVKLLETVLGIEEISREFDLEKYSKDDTTARITFSNMLIPQDTKEKDYSIEAIVYFDDEDETKSEFATLTVTSCVPPVPPKPPVELISLTALEPSVVGNSFSIPVKVTNGGDNLVQYTMELANVEVWAEPANPISVILDGGQSSTYYFYLTKKEGVTGVQGATIVLKSGNLIVKSQSLSVDTGAVEDSKITGFSIKDLFTGINSKVFWIIGDIVLIVLALFFIKLLFTSRNK